MYQGEWASQMKQYVVLIGSLTYLIKDKGIRCAEEKALKHYTSEYPGIDTSHLIVSSFTLRDYKQAYGGKSGGLPAN